MKRKFFPLISLLIGIGFTLILLESFLRLNPRFGYSYNSCNFKNEKVMLLDEHNLGYIRPSALLGYEIIPNCHDVPYLPAPSNSYGLIGKEYKLEKENNTFRILLLGDSIAWQNSTREFLESDLNNNHLLNSRYKFEIWNAGCPSYDVRRYYTYLKHRGLSYKPDMVLIFLFMNDFCPNMNVYYKDGKGVTEYYFPITEVSKIYTVNPFLMKHSYLYRFIVLRLDNYLLTKKKRQDVDQEEEVGTYYLQMIKEISQNKNIPLFVIIFPYLKTLTEYEGWQYRQYKNICKVLNDLEINHLNLYEHLPPQDLYGLRENKKDEIHPGIEGDRLIAKIIYDYLLDDFFKNK
jgi:lysophospholipase L1-like esterase